MPDPLYDEDKTLRKIEELEVKGYREGIDFLVGENGEFSCTPKVDRSVFDQTFNVKELT